MAVLQYYAEYIDIINTSTKSSKINKRLGNRLLLKALLELYNLAPINLVQ